MKKNLSKLLCMMLSACLMFGCGNGSGKTAGEGDMPANGKEERTDKNSTPSPDGGTDQGRTPGNTEQNTPDTAGDTSKDKADGEKAGNEPEDATPSPDATPSANQPGDGQDGTGTTAQPAIPMLENYRERGINLPQEVEAFNEWICNTVQNEKGEIEWFTVDSKLEKADSLIWKYTLTDGVGEWKREPVKWTEGIKGKLQKGRITVFLGEDGNYYAYYCDEEQLYHFVKQTGDSYEEIVIPDWDITDEREYRTIPGIVAVAENGNIVMADQSYECFIYSPEDGRILDRFPCGWYQSMCVEGNDLFLHDRKTGAVIHYDVQEQKQLPSIGGEFEGGVRLAVAGDDLYACCPEGLFIAKKDGGTFQKILDAGRYYFSKENGTLLNLFLAGDVFYVTYAEQHGILKKYAPRNPDEEFLGTFTVYSLDENELIFSIVAEFQAQHPELDVFYETGEGAKGSTSSADRIRALNARILAGDGPDVLVLDGLPVQSYVEKGILSDLQEVLSEEIENITPNIVANCRTGDALYKMPVRFRIPMFGTSGQDTAIFDSLESLVEYCEGEEKQALPTGLPYDYILELLYYNFPPEFVSEDGSVDKGKIEEFLGLLERFCSAENALPLADSAYQTEKNAYMNGLTVDWWFMARGQEIMMINLSGDIGYYPDRVRQRGGELTGNHGLYFTNGMLGINARSEHKELAELFVKEAFSRKLQEINGYRTGFPVHKGLLEKYAKSDQSYSLLGTRLIETGEEIILHGYKQEEAQWTVELAMAADTPVEHNQMIYDIIQDEACSFLSGRKGKEAAAAEIANRISLYYFE